MKTKTPTGEAERELLTLLEENQALICMEGLLPGMPMKPLDRKVPSK